MLDWHSCQICYPLEIKLLLVLIIIIITTFDIETSGLTGLGAYDLIN